MMITTIIQASSTNWQILPPELHQMIITEALNSSIPASDPECHQLENRLNTLLGTSYALSSSYLWQPLNKLQRDIEAALHELHTGRKLMKQVANKQAWMGHSIIAWGAEPWPFCSEPHCGTCGDFLPLTRAFHDMSDQLVPLGRARRLVEAALETLNGRYERRIRVAREARHAELARKKRADDELAAAEWNAFDQAQGMPRKQEPVQAPVSQLMLKAAAFIETAKPRSSIRDQQELEVEKGSREGDYPEKDADTDTSDEDTDAEERVAEVSYDDDDMVADEEDSSRIANAGVTFNDFARALRSR